MTFKFRPIKAIARCSLEGSDTKRNSNTLAKLCKRATDGKDSDKRKRPEASEYSVTQRIWVDYTTGLNGHEFLKFTSG